MRESLASFDYPGRFEELSEVAEATTLPTREELDRLPKAILQEMIAQSEVKTFNSPVSMGGSDEAVEDVEVTRVGTFIAATNNDAGFVTIERNGAGDFYLEKLQRQPGGRFRSAFRSLINGQEGSTMQVNRNNLRTVRESKILELDVGPATGSTGIAARLDLAEYRACLIEGAEMGDARFITSQETLDKLKLKRGDKARIWLRS